MRDRDVWREIVNALVSTAVARKTDPGEGNIYLILYKLERTDRSCRFENWENKSDFLEKTVCDLNFGFLGVHHVT